MAETELYACTAENPGALTGFPGLLGPGASPNAGPVLGMGSDIARTSIDIGGSYPADAAAASRYLIAKLKYDTDMTPEERVSDLRQLQLALRDAETTLNKTEVGKLYKEAQGVPGLTGDILNAAFGPTNIGSSLATATGAALATVQKAPTSDLLDIPESTRQKLLAWARKGGNQGIKSARKRFGQTLELVREDGKWMFEIPANKKAAGYVIRGRAAQTVVRIPAYRQAALDALEVRNRLNLAGFDKSIGGHIVGFGAGGLLALGPQAISDAIDADNMHQFMSLEAHSQVANAAGWLAGAGAGAILPSAVAFFVAAPVEVPVLLVLAVGFGVGLTAQLLVSKFYGKRVGDGLVHIADGQPW
ncbi:hypothetical protein AAHK20_31820 [Trinickia sp. YCB016]